MGPKITDGEVLAFIEKFTELNGYAPTVRDVAVAMQVASPSTAYSRLKKLQSKGLIDWAPERSRTLRRVS